MPGPTTGWPPTSPRPATTTPGPGRARAPAARAGRPPTSRPAFRTSWRSPISSTATPAGHKAALHGERIEQALAGTVAVGLLGLVALELLGPAAALVAMALAAGYPVLIEQTGTLVAENLLVVLELAAVWTALRARGSPHPYRWIAATGVLTGLATLTHQNAILLDAPAGRGGVVGGDPRRAGSCCS